MSEKNNYIQGKTGPWEVVIGLEVHAQITSKAKLFSGASTVFGGDPNTQVSFIDAGFPGMLPLINNFCVEQAIKTGFGLNAQINKISIFDRKNYFYADLPQGYQISQHLYPIVGKGYLEIELEDGTVKRINITRLHLEQDAGKSIHDQHPNKSYIDLNRSGIALMEIVSEPDIRSVEEAQAYIKKLRGLLRYLGTCDGNMEQGSLRADVNVSLRRPGEDYGTRAEIKNVNSVRFMGQAITYEIQRQMEILENGGQIDQETRLFDASKGITRSMRNKENAHDYRYFPDPDLPPLVLSDEEIERIRALLPELPDAKKARFIRDYQLSAYDAGVLSSELETVSYFETALKHLKEANEKSIKQLANWIIGELFAALNRDSLLIEASKVSPQSLAELINFIYEGTISGRLAKDIFTEMWETGEHPDKIINAKGLVQVSDEGEIATVIEKILNENQDKVMEYQSGKDKLFGFFVGQVMKVMQGKGNPTIINKVLLEKLKS
ncbi:MAG: aspartyl/glutamyl-tRNA amidotransferase subunit B [Caedibacter sp. 38-128]|nr:Asp-tRNA(Asn)/Glu-tRNA(Gln) amidotransferase subunit GatB [Holosporales bacterium]OJX04900.1 MAG: aspartyl/glutamyl-tRNA amidotransferase subunit B [Caedibacter sp. 38-128]